MRRMIMCAVLLTGLISSVYAGDVLQPTFSNGFKLVSEDGSSSFGINAMVNTDWSWYVNQDESNRTAYNNFENGNEIRNARLGISGVMYSNVQYRLQYDFASGHPGVTVAYMGISGIPVLGTVRMGHMVEPFSMTFATSPTAHPFMERALPWVMTPGWNTGIMAFNTVMNKRVYWGAGVFKDTGSSGQQKDDDNLGITGRVNGAVLNQDGGRKLVRIGVAYSHRKTSGSMECVAGPESHLAPSMINTGKILTETVDMVGGELASVFGPFSLQAEGIASYLDVSGDSDPLLGYYATVGYLLTGESKSYSTSGMLGRVTPKNNFGPEGIGAVELLVRYSALDLDGAGANAGVLTAISAGVNWSLNPKSRVMLNYVYGDHDTNGAVSTVQMRFSVDI
jgi:phosphate-selective porin OprO and OprP